MSQDPEFMERQIDSRQVFTGSVIEVCEDTVSLPSGLEARREYVRHPGTVMVLARLDNDRFLFVRQYRHALQRVMLELPAGRIKPGEESLVAAKRELLEETGHVAARWSPLTSFHPCAGYSNETIQVFIATRLDYLGTEIDQAAPLEATSLPLGGAIASVLQGSITDARTIVALFFADRALKSGTL